MAARRRSVAESKIVALRRSAIRACSEALRATVGSRAAGKPWPAAAEAIIAATARSISVDRPALGVEHTSPNAGVTGAELLAGVSVSTVRIRAAAAVTYAAGARVLGYLEADPLAIRGQVRITVTCTIAAGEGSGAVTIQVDTTLDAAIGRPGARITELPRSRPDAVTGIAALSNITDFANRPKGSTASVSQALDASAVRIAAGQITLVPVGFAAEVDAYAAPAARHAWALRTKLSSVPARGLVLPRKRNALVVHTAAAVASGLAVAVQRPAEIVIAAGETVFPAALRGIAGEQ